MNIREKEQLKSENERLKARVEELEKELHSKFEDPKILDNSNYQHLLDVVRTSAATISNMDRFLRRRFTQEIKEME